MAQQHLVGMVDEVERYQVERQVGRQEGHQGFLVALVPDRLICTIFYIPLKEHTKVNNCIDFYLTFSPHIGGTHQ